MTAGHTRFVVYRDKAGEWRWRLVSPNGRKIGVSGEGYKTKRSARLAVDRLCAVDLAYIAVVEE